MGRGGQAADEHVSHSDNELLNEIYKVTMTFISRSELSVKQNLLR